MSEQAVFFTFVKTPRGTFRITATKHGLRAIQFPGRHSAQPNYRPIPPQVRNHLIAARKYLYRFFSGRVNGPPKIRIDLGPISKFDRSVLANLRNVPSAKTITYGQLAKQCRSPRAARAVGNALSRNPVPILIPCHRVVRGDGSLGGYAPGTRWKRILLELEHQAKARRP